MLVDGGTRLYSIEDQSILLLLHGVYLHITMILQMHHFDLQIYLGHGKIRVNSYGGVQWSRYYIITHLGIICHFGPFQFSIKQIICKT